MGVAGTMRVQHPARAATSMVKDYGDAARGGKPQGQVGEGGGLRASARSAARHGAGFLVAGTLAFLTDAVVLTMLNQGLGFDPFSARFFSVCCAMVVGFFGHRSLTFRVAGPPTFGEFLAYAGVAWSTVAVNYAIYSVILLVQPDTTPLSALVIASIVAMGWSYVGMRIGVFGKPSH